MAPVKFCQIIAASLSLTILALWLHLECTSADEEVSGGGPPPPPPPPPGKKSCPRKQRPCCDHRTLPCNQHNADDCCHDEWSSCNSGRCENKHGCTQHEKDCCNLLSDVPCLNGHNCPLRCHCCSKTEECSIDAGLLGFWCVRNKVVEELKAELAELKNEL